MVTTGVILPAQKHTYPSSSAVLSGVAYTAEVEGPSEVTAVTSQVTTSLPDDFYHQEPVRKRPIQQICHTCNADITTQVQTGLSNRGAIWAAVCCLLCLLPCSCIVCFLPSCNDVMHYCPKCRSFIGTYEN